MPHAPGPRVPQTDMKKLDLKDFALRALLIVAGSIAAVLLAMKGDAQAIPALAVGGTLGAFRVRAGSSESEE